MKYIDSIENKHRVVRVDRTPEFDSEEMSIANYLSLYPHGKYSQQIRGIVGDGGQKDYKERVDDRIETLKTLLFSAWKMCSVGSDGKEILVKYVFPYYYNDTNNYMFFLESIAYNNFYYLNGLTESTADINSDQFWAKTNLVFREVDFSEMLEHSKRRCDEAAEQRLIKLIEREGVIKVKDEENG